MFYLIKSDDEDSEFRKLAIKYIVCRINCDYFPG